MCVCASPRAALTTRHQSTYVFPITSKSRPAVPLMTVFPNPSDKKPCFWGGDDDSDAGSESRPPPDYEDVGAGRVGVQMEAEQTGETTSKQATEAINQSRFLLSWMRAAFVLPNMSDRLFAIVTFVCWVYEAMLISPFCRCCFSTHVSLIPSSTKQLINRVCHITTFTKLDSFPQRH